MKLKMNIASTPTRQALFNLDATVDDFIVAFRRSSIRRRIGGETLKMTVKQALQLDSTTKKLLTDSRFAQ